jgi:hypothetical protein
MTDSQDSGGLTVNLGKEIDRSIGEVLKALLLPPATELGGLLGDAVGLMGDRIKRKRSLNLQAGLGDVRTRLEIDHVNIANVTPPKEEELHLLLNGMSLSDDGDVRRLWVGLFAKAIEPDSGISAERPFIQILENLTPLDAKIIDFLALAHREDETLKDRRLQMLRPNVRTKVPPEEQETHAQARKSAIDDMRDTIERIEVKAKEYGLDALSSGWADNLARLGVIERTPQKPPHISNPSFRKIDERALVGIVDFLQKQIATVDQAVVRNATKPKALYSRERSGFQIILEMNLTSFGNRFVKACGL